MKLILRLGVMAGIIALILWYLQQQVDEKRADTKPAPTPSPASTPAPTPLPAQSAAAPPPPVQVAAPAARIQALAAQARLSVAGVRQQNDWTVVTVRGYDRNDLNNFLDVAQRAGLRDIDVNQNAYRQFMAPGGRVVYEGVYRLRF